MKRPPYAQLKLCNKRKKEGEGGKIKNAACVFTTRAAAAAAERRWCLPCERRAAGALVSVCETRVWISNAKRLKSLHPPLRR